VQDGLQRIFDFVKSDSFTFVVNEGCFESMIAEAVLIWPAVCEVIRNDRNVDTFVISGSDFDSSYFGIILDIIRSSDCVCFSSDQELSLLSICRLLGNERLSLLLLASVKSTSASNIKVNTGSTTTSTSESTVSTNILICDGNVEYRASQFYWYSAEELRRLDKNILHDLLSSQSLGVMN
jgi:hypothetical protein